jgi:lysophospholipid acyltransferase (LPLAT)-like uncharacterized protein
MLRGVLGFLLGVVARVWLSTLRVRVELHPALLGDDAESVPWILSFFHGTQWPLLAWTRRRKTAVMVSLSKDGEMQARALATLGFDVVRGSSSRNGARGLAALVRKVRGAQLPGRKAAGVVGAKRRGTPVGNERDAAFAVDGPRGPYGVPKPGAAFVAERTGAWLVPMGSAIRSGKVFARAWDRFALAWPFTTVAVVLGAPVPAEKLGSAIEEANGRAASLLQRSLADVAGGLPRDRYRPDGPEAALRGLCDPSDMVPSTAD